MPSEEEKKQAYKYYEECRKNYHSNIKIKENFENKLNSLKSQKYCIIDILNYSQFLEGTFELIENEWINPSPKIARLTKEGYSVYGGPSMINVTYVSHFDNTSLDNIETFLKKSEIKTLLESYYNCNIGVCNVRAYRFTHNPDPNNTHKDDVFAEGMYQFNKHKDGLLPETIKIMIFKNPIDKMLTLQDGLTQLNIPNKSSRWIEASGLSPTCLIFKSNEILHRAPRPEPGRVRDVIELTIIPKLENDFPIIASGAHAGFPLNLRTHWSKNNEK